MSYYQHDSSQPYSFSSSFDISLENSVLLELYLLRLVSSSIKMARIESKTLGRGSCLVTVVFYLKKERIKAKPAAILLIVFNEF